MAFFRRRDARPDDAVAAFWSWWTTEGADACAAAIAESAPDRMVDDISQRVQRMRPGLAWELAAGDLSEHKLVVTAEGNPDLRAVARRWLLAAPAADETWTYDDHRGPAEDPEGVSLRGGPDAPDIAFSELRLSARKEGTKLHVTIHHPAFPSLPDEARLQVAFLALDAALGENDTEVWIGQIDTAEQPPIDGFGLLALRSLVADIRRDSLDADGRPGWALLQGEGPDGPVLAMARSPLHPLFGPVFTRHVAARVPYVARTEVGLPASQSLESLRVLEDRVTAAMGDDGLLVAHESSAGTRTFHLYVDPDGDAVDRLAATVDDWPDGDVRVLVTDSDPGWESVRHLRG
jgi:hypothetical protein